MRILQVATLVTPDGAYGGPVRVALNQLAELQKLGHTVEFAAATSGFDRTPTALQGVPARLFPARRVVPKTGYAGLASPGLTRFVKQHVDDYDVIHVHVARDLITLPVASIVAKSATPLVLQPHGMIDESSNPLATVIDSMLTRRVLRGSDEILSLTPLESSSLRAVAGPELPITMIANGVLLPDLPVSTTSRREMLFLARLHPRKRAPMFVDAAIALVKEGTDFDFALIGPDEGDGGTVQELIDSHGLAGRIRWEGALPPDETLTRMAGSSVYVLPSVGEVLSMSILEAMSLGLPIVITDSNGLAPSIRETRSGLVTDGSLDGLTDAMRAMTASAESRAEMGRNARQLVRDKYSIEAVGKRLEAVYESHLGHEKITQETT